MYELQLIVILATVGVTLGNIPNGCQLDIRATNDAWQIEDLNKKIVDIRVKLGEDRYKDDLIKALKETIEMQNVSCTSKDDNSAENLKIKIENVQKTEDFYKNYAKKFKDLQHCQTKNDKLRKQFMQEYCTSEIEVPNTTMEPEIEATSCLSFGYSTSVHKIKLPGSSPFIVLCDGQTAGPGWMVIQHRIDGSVDFYKDWAACRKGFGIPDREFWIGLDNLYRLTNYKQHELYIQFESFCGNFTYARYDNFVVGNEYEKFKLKSFGTYSGEIKDAFSVYGNVAFSTYDNDNDDWKDGNCAVKYHGSWWYREYANYKNNLNGKYYSHEVNELDAIYWTNNYNYKSVKMLIRPKN